MAPAQNRIPNGSWRTVSVVTTLLLTACATIVSGSTQTLSVITDPAGASCILRRDGAVVGVIRPTPGSITVGKGSAPILVQCDKDGFAEASGSFDSHFQGASVGNILLGGLIGIAVDAASGATAEYPTELTMKLTALIFRDAAERDAFFAKRRAALIENVKPVTGRPAMSEAEQEAARQRIEAEYRTARIQP
jgi:hypothetical protein